MRCKYFSRCIRILRVLCNDLSVTENNHTSVRVEVILNAYSSVMVNPDFPYLALRHPSSMKAARFAQLLFDRLQRCPLLDFNMSTGTAN